MSAPHLVVLGSLNVDLIINVEDLPKSGQTIFSESFIIENGGKGANQAVAASRLGATVTMIGRVGVDVFSEQVLTDLRSEAVDVSRITKDLNHSTGIALITVDSKSENTIVVSSGANMNCGQVELDFLQDRIVGANCLMLQNEVPLEINLEAAKIAQRHNVPVIWDPAPFVRDIDQLIRKVDFLTPNQKEAELLTNSELKDLESVHRALLKMKGLTRAICIITMGPEGLFFLSGDELIHVPSSSVLSVDSVAAGDAFTAGLAVGISEGLTLSV
ncbi:MAG: PfkB family carbohydrate kinase, partial [Dehalococcoidia bacterium]|nr:PfkB family carbohydrate kinase [Dehalococcoidia bacterium]